ncbi:MAG: phosphate/phosphite/phosphonate ABC transporter substrate-binding protein [Rhodocyclales bacterium]|nr:phosphate/phosphite/phosphonate ABC transporter substrate-binding protein [Rhodocyclales bacterium]
MALAAQVHAAEPRPLVFGVLNQQSPVLTAERWNPILQYLSQVTGIPLQLRMGRTVQETDAMMGRGEFDLAYTNHNFQTEFDGVYKVIARWGGDPIRCVIVVPAGSPLKTMKDLQGKRLAFPSADAFIAYAVPKVALLSAAVKVEEVFAGNQEGALAQLKAQQVEGAVVNSRFLVQYAQRENLSYREIFVSEAYAELPIIVHPRVPKGQVDALRRALIGMQHDPRATPLLLKLKFPGFEPAVDREYDNVRRIYRVIGE